MQTFAPVFEECMNSSQVHRRRQIWEIEILVEARRPRCRLGLNPPRCRVLPSHLHEWFVSRWLTHMICAATWLNQRIHSPPRCRVLPSHLHEWVVSRCWLTHMIHVTTWLNQRIHSPPRCRVLPSQFTWVSHVTMMTHSYDMCRDMTQSHRIYSPQRCRVLPSHLHEWVVSRCWLTHMICVATWLNQKMHSPQRCRVLPSHLYEWVVSRNEWVMSRWWLTYMMYVATWLNQRIHSPPQCRVLPSHFTWMSHVTTTHSYDMCCDMTHSYNIFSTSMPGAAIAFEWASHVTMTPSYDLCRDTTQSKNTSPQCRALPSRLHEWVMSR